MIGVNQLKDIWVIWGVSKMDTYPRLFYCIVFLMASRFKRNGFGTHVQTRLYIISLFGRFLHLTLSNFNMEPEKLGSMLIIASCWKMFSLISQIQFACLEGEHLPGCQEWINICHHYKTNCHVVWNSRPCSNNFDVHQHHLRFWTATWHFAFRKGHHWAIT